MALDAQQQAQVDIQLALENARHVNQLALEQLRVQNQSDIQSAQTQAEAKRAKLEAVRLAKETLIENARSKPVDTREVTAADITAFAATLEAYVNA